MPQSFAGQNLKYLRKLRGLTQEEFATKLGIKRSLLGAYEEERAEPRIDVLETISDLFKVSLDDLLRRDISEVKGSYLAKRRQQKLLSENNLIHFVPVKAAAGYLAGYADEEFCRLLILRSLQVFHYNPMLQYHPSVLQIVNVRESRWLLHVPSLIVVYRAQRPLFYQDL